MGAGGECYTPLFPHHGGYYASQEGSRKGINLSFCLPGGSQEGYISLYASQRVPGRVYLSLYASLGMVEGSTPRYMPPWVCL